MAVKWFVIKTLYRTNTADRPEKPDLYYDPDATMVEERILLIKAVNRTEAVHKAEREAKDYAFKGNYNNPYNQMLKTNYTGYLEVFELRGHPGDKKEVFTTTRIISRRVRDKKIAQIYLGNLEGRKIKNKRKKFMNKKYLTESP